jgi:hypothetical protein
VAATGAFWFIMAVTDFITSALLGPAAATVGAATTLDTDTLGMDLLMATDTGAADLVTEMLGMALLMSMEGAADLVTDTLGMALLMSMLGAAALVTETEAVEGLTTSTLGACGAGMQENGGKCQSLLLVRGKLAVEVWF